MSILILTKRYYTTNSSSDVLVSSPLPLNNKEHFRQFIRTAFRLLFSHCRDKNLANNYSSLIEVVVKAIQTGEIVATLPPIVDTIGEALDFFLGPDGLDYIQLALTLKANTIKLKLLNPSKEATQETQISTEQAIEEMTTRLGFIPQPFELAELDNDTLYYVSSCWVRNESFPSVVTRKIQCNTLNSISMQDLPFVCNKSNNVAPRSDRRVFFVVDNLIFNGSALYKTEKLELAPDSIVLVETNHPKLTHLKLLLKTLLI